MCQRCCRWEHHVFYLVSCKRRMTLRTMEVISQKKPQDVSWLPSVPVSNMSLELKQTTSTVSMEFLQLCSVHRNTIVVRRLNHR
jgi:hypothetical protein